MRCRLLNPRGFCAGVRKALDILDNAKDAYVYKDIVHNESVLEHYRRRGIVFVSSIDEIPTAKTVVFSAHGVSKNIRDSVRGEIRDGTCTVLKEIHRKVQEALGNPIIYLGNDASHDEVEAILSYGDILFVKSGEVDIDVIRDYVKGKEAYLFTQTTLNIQTASKDIEQIRKAATLLTGPTICYATQERQDALVANPGNDLVIVVGSKKSSNSLRLLEIAKIHNKNACLIMSKEELMLHDASEIALTAGASTPERDVQTIVEHLRALGYTIEETF